MQYKLKEQKSAIKNVKTLYKSREKVTKLFNDYSKHKSRSKLDHGEGEGPKY